MLIGLWGGWQVFRKQDWHPGFLRCLVGLTFSGWVATIAGWYVTEIGRQPLLVQGVLLARDAVGAVAPAQVGLTLTTY